MAEPNPYESPREPRPKFTAKAGLAIGVLMVLVIPSAFICGGVTCYATGVAFESVATEIGWVLGIPLWMFIAVGVPIAVYRHFKNKEIDDLINKSDEERDSHNQT